MALHSMRSSRCENGWLIPFLCTAFACKDDIDRTTTAVAASMCPVGEPLDHEFYCNINHVLHVDNYLLCGMHANCTCRTNRVKATDAINFTKTGGDKGHRGDINLCQPAHGLQSVSWWDKKPVDRLSSIKPYKKTITRNAKRCQKWSTCCHLIS